MAAQGPRRVGRGPDSGQVLHKQNQTDAGVEEQPEGEGGGSQKQQRETAPHGRENKRAQAQNSRQDAGGGKRARTKIFFKKLKNSTKTVSIRKSDIKIMSIPEGKEKAKGIEGLFKEIIDTFPNSGKSRTSEYKKLTEHLIIATQKDLLQDILY